MGRFHLPINHRPAMRVPQGGAMCANCIHYIPHSGMHGQCGQPDFARYYGTTFIPDPPDEFCSDWYEPPAELVGG